MKDSILFVSASNVPIIEYENEITLKDLLAWKDKLKAAAVDVMKVVVFANLELFSHLQRTALKQGIAMMKKSDSIIPFSENNQLPIDEKLEFTGLNIFEEGVTEFDESKIVMKVFVYEVYNNYYLNSTKED